MKHHVFRMLIAFVLFGLTACTAPTQIAQVEGEPSAPVETFTTVTNDRSLAVDDVQVQIGVGSPIPIDIFVSGTWPDLCAQLTAIQQQIVGFNINVTLLTTPADPNCPPDQVGLPFRIAIPLNGVQLPEGTYTITVNGTRTNFTWPAASAGADPNPPAQPVATPIAAPASVDPVPTDVQYVMALTDVNMRSGPGTNYAVIDKIFSGQIAQVTGAAPDQQWWQVICPDNSVGDCWLSSDPTLTEPTTGPSSDPAPNPIQETGDAVVESIDVQMLESMPVQANAVLRGYFPDGCTVIDSYDQAQAGSTIRIRLTTRRTNTVCAQVVTFFEQSIPLNVLGLPAGNYDVRVNELIAPFTLAQDNTPDLPPVSSTDVPFVMAQQDITIYAGPGEENPVVGQVAEGMVAKVTGVSADQQWWRVVCPDETGNCWVAADPALTQPIAPP